MWNFFDFGLLMPALVDDDLRLRPDWAEASENGRFDFQVRARIKDHAKYFRKNFMKPGTYGKIIATPDHDYNYRFYTTKTAYADGMREAVMAIDYRKFKPQAEKYPHGKKYHDTLISVWSDVCALNTPGDIWGPYSKKNPEGYRSALTWTDDDQEAWEGRRIGDSFRNIDFGDFDDDEDAATSVVDSYFGEDESGELVFLNWDERRARKTMKDMDKYGIPMKDWCEYSSPGDFAALVPELKKHFGKNTIKKMIARNKEAVAEWAEKDIHFSES